MIKSIGHNYRIYGLIIVKIVKKSLVLDYGLSNAIFETPNHPFTLDLSCNYDPLLFAWDIVQIHSKIHLYNEI
jgi:hypothetical protein